ncbi:MAG TPA: hypothetical protein VHR66_32465 [Gemmataceae bacterium]|jgi:hypothetical protein|nr:hypothetical protein [Gemmataceae bacterium]
MIPDPAPPFELDASGRTREQIRRILDRAAERGIQPAIAHLISAILQHLIADPRDWGDPLWRYHRLQMTRYRGTLGSFRCEYTVHDRIPTVVLIELLPLPGNPLHGENFDDA